MKKTLTTLALILTLSLGIWTLAVTFSPITSNFQAGDEVSATTFNDLFNAINENFNAAKTAIEANETAISTLQSTPSEGLAKASAAVVCSNANSSVSRSFSTVEGATVSVENGPVTGRCTINFGFKVDDRLWNVSAIAVNSPQFAGCFPGTGANENKLFCSTFNGTGTAENGSLMVTIF